MFFLLLANAFSVQARCTTASLRVRSGPGTQYTIVGGLKEGQIVDLVSTRKENNFYKIKYNGITAYASASYLSVISGGGGGGSSTGKGVAIYNTAKTRLGCRYVYGATGPTTFDCSGLVMWSHKQHGISMPRVSKDQARGGRAGSGRTGDCIFFGNPVHHVGICDGKGNYIHAPQPGEVVKISQISRSRDIACYRRYW